MPPADDDILRFDADQIERLGPVPPPPVVDPPRAAPAPSPPPAGGAPYPGPVPVGHRGATPTVPADGPTPPRIPWKFLLGTLAGAAVAAGTSYLLRNLNDFTEAQQSPPRSKSRSASRRRRRRRNRTRAKRRDRQNT